jgi:N,N'-diacetylchitobiose non-reducing end deacetylase
MIKMHGEDLLKPGYCDYLPLPDLLKAENLLVVQPHPDDLEIGAGATVARMAQAGTKVTCITVTDGSVGTYNPNIKPEALVTTRRKEATDSAAILGIDNLQWLDYPDGGTLPYEKVRADLTSVIRTIKPDAILVCDPWLPYEVHTDHIRTGLAAAEAGFLSNMPLFCPEDLNNGLEPHGIDCFAFYYTAYPNTVIDVSESWDKKLRAIDCHKSQFSNDQAEMLKAFLTAKAREQAAGIDCSLVESFKVLSALHLHIFEQAWQC